MRAPTILLLAATALGGCAYSFEDDDARFECNSDDDCVGDDRCAGYALVANSAKSFCVEAFEASAAIGMRVASAPLDNCQLFGESAGSTWTASVRLTDSSDATTTVSFDPGSSTSCGSPDSARRGGPELCCVGGPDEEESRDGRASILCFFQPENISEVELTLSYTYGGGAGNGSAASGIIEVPTGGDASLIWATAKEISPTPSWCPQ